MSTPLTQTLAQLEFDPHLYTATAVLNPAVILLSAGTHLDILLARDFETVGHEEFALRAVRRIRVPHGWRHRVAEFASRVMPIRVPEEELFNDVIAMCRISGRKQAAAYIALTRSADGESIPLAHSPFPLRPLTVEEYRRLSKMRGRELRRQIMRMFRLTPAFSMGNSPLHMLKRLVTRPVRALVG